MPIMLRVLPAQLTITVVSGFRFRASAHKNQIAAGNIDTAGNTETSILLRRSYVEDHQVGGSLLQASKFFREISGMVLS
mgnify:CR=1 FL=1